MKLDRQTCCGLICMRRTFSRFGFVAFEQPSNSLKTSHEQPGSLKISYNKTSVAATLYRSA